jgi:hypothetical protein
MCKTELKSVIEKYRKMSIRQMFVRLLYESGKRTAPRLETEGEKAMRYLVLIYGDEKAGVPMTEAENQAYMAEYFAFNNMARERGIYEGGEALHPTSAATTVRVRDGKVLMTDGPFAETKEQLGGYYILNCQNLDEAIEMTTHIPGVRNGSIEIRPIYEFN